jgi:hypothetical protein
MLYDAVGAQGIYPNDYDLLQSGGLYLPNAEMLRVVHAPPRREIAWYMGHYSFAFVRHAMRSAEIITFLRHPIARSISMLKHRQRSLGWQDRPLTTLLDRHRFLEAQLTDYMTKIFSIEDPHKGVNSVDPVDEWALDRAIKNLAEVDIGFTETFSQDIRRLATKYQLSLPEERRLNVIDAVEAPSEELIERIRPLVKYDLIFYEAARQLRGKHEKGAVSFEGRGFR